MVQVVKHLHQLGVMHRDIKPENFLLSDKTDQATLKLADFGLSTYFKPGQKFTHIVGSAYYVAPEVLILSSPYQETCLSRLCMMQRRSYVCLLLTF